MQKLSIIVPCFNEEASIPIFYQATKRIIKQIPVQTDFIFINDGSSDQTLNKLRLLKRCNQQMHYLSFTRNFGKEAALYAGLKFAVEQDSDFLAIMDVDLQDPPEMLVKMYELISEKHYDMVGTKRIDRKGEQKIKSWLSNQFYHVLDHLSSTKLAHGVRDYRMMTKQVAESILQMPEYSRFSKGLFSWIGYQTIYLPYHNRERVAGTSHWSTIKLFKYALTGIGDFSQVFLNITVWLGLFSCLLAFLGIIFIVIRHFINPTYAIYGWSSLICIILLIGGIQLFCLGIIGRYIGNIYLQAKHRPLYLIKEKK